MLGLASALLGGLAAAAAGAAEVDAVLAPWAAPAIDEAKAAPYKKLLEDHVRQFMARGPYAPLIVILGQSGVVRVFAQSGETFGALSRAYPYLPADLQRSVKELLTRELASRPPCDPEECFYEVWQGRRRESFAPVERLEPKALPPLEIAAAYGVWLFAERTGSYEAVSEEWAKKIGPALSGKLMARFAIDPVKGHWAMNRVILGLIGYVRLAERFGDQGASAKARAKLAIALEELRRYWSERPTFPDEKYFGGVTPAAGDALVLFGSRVARPEARGAYSLAGLARLQGELARLLSEEPMKANVLRVLRAIGHVGPAWYVSGAEPYIQQGENAQDVPDEAPGILFAKAFIERVPFEELVRYVDVPLCEGDLLYVERLVTVIERSGEPGKAGPDGRAGPDR